MEITKAELKKITEFGDFLKGHGYEKAANEAYSLVTKIQRRAGAVKG